ncbi:hypothetical protein GCM10010394_05040 [Streptomyces crystallinus]|uniref:HNH endonuclease n=1 Tax=Streptomyces crystallinus TaxID=68191 RepID=A0ABP3PZA2_9ACTN
MWKCTTGYTRAHDHDGTCGSWERTAICWDSLWFTAFEKASTQSHAFVQAVYAVNGRTRTVYEHVEGGGLCKGCWHRHENTHTHAITKETGLCIPCVRVQNRRGPLTRTPFGNEFMCDDCRSGFRRVHLQTCRADGRDPDKRLYRPVLDFAREDARVHG